MAEGELGAVFKGLAEDAGQAGKDIGESIAQFTETTADNEDANVARTLEADAQTARQAEAAGQQAGPEAGPAGSGTAPAGGQYSGGLIKVPKPDPDADALASRIGGESRVKFENDPKGREFDTVNNDYIAQAKPGDQRLSSDFRNQAKATFEAAKATGRSVYYHFNGPPAPGVIAKLNEYAARYGVKVVIDTQPFQ